MNWTVAALTEFVQRLMSKSNPMKPAFLAYNSSTDSNVTGDGTVYTVDFDTEVFDQHGDFASDTFTAPIGGKYLLSTSVYYLGMTDATSLYIALTTSNRTYYHQLAIGNAANNSMPLTVVADMDAGDTAYVTITGTAGTKNIDVYGAAAAQTFISGCLIT